jgi:hypothetical protein
MWPLASLALLLLALAVPAVALARFPGQRRSAKLYASGVVALAGAFGVVRGAMYLVALRPQIQGADFFYFLCVARDTLDGVPSSAQSYAYFPGSYRFWQLALSLGGRDLTFVQCAYALVLAGNAALLCVTVRRCTSNWAFGALAAVGYVAICSRIEGGFGIAEPIASLPLVAAVAIWSGEPLRGRRGYALAITLGAGIGLATYVKQQGGLQAAGWLSLAVLNLFISRDRRHDLRGLALVPGTALVVFLLGILAEGHGLLPLRAGLKVIGGYAAHASLLDNLTNAFERVSSLVALATLAFIALIVVMVFRPKLRAERWVGVTVFAFGAAGGTLFQFTKRGYRHYALLTTPWLLLACILLAVALVRLLPGRLRESNALPFACLFFAALPFLRTEDRAYQAFFFLWPVEPIPPPNLGHRWLQRDMADDIRKLGRLVHPREDVLVLPPRHNELHFDLGTRPLSFPDGYAWGSVHTKATMQALASQTLAAVIVLNHLGSKSDAEIWHNYDCDEAVTRLGVFGFHRVATLQAVSVWRRD